MINKALPWHRSIKRSEYFALGFCLQLQASDPD
jgi:hypothetical protein